MVFSNSNSTPGGTPSFFRSMPLPSRSGTTSVRNTNTLGATTSMRDTNTTTNSSSNVSGATTSMRNTLPPLPNLVQGLLSSNKTSSLTEAEKNAYLLAGHFAHFYLVKGLTSNTSLQPKDKIRNLKLLNDFFGTAARYLTEKDNAVKMVDFLKKVHHCGSGVPDDLSVAAVAGTAMDCMHH